MELVMVLSAVDKCQWQLIAAGLVLLSCLSVAEAATMVRSTLVVCAAATWL